jgi:hypothetical protein
VSSTIPLSLQLTTSRSNADAMRADLNGEAPDPSHRIRYWRRELRIGDFTAAAATSDEVALYADLTALALGRLGQSGDFPANVWINVAPPYLRRITAFSGGAVSACTIEFGDNDDPNGLLTATNVFTGAAAGIITTSGAAQYAARFEADYAPVVIIRTTSANVSALTAGACEIVIPYVPMLKNL